MSQTVCGEALKVAVRLAVCLTGKEAPIKATTTRTPPRQRTTMPSHLRICIIHAAESGIYSLQQQFGLQDSQSYYRKSSYIFYNVGMSVHFSQLSTKGQIVIPAKLREAMKLEPGTTVALEREGEALVLRPITVKFIHSLRGIARGKGLGALREQEHRKERR